MGLDWITRGRGVFEPNDLLACVGGTLSGKSCGRMNRGIVTKGRRVDGSVTLDAFVGRSWRSRGLVSMTFGQSGSHSNDLTWFLDDWMRFERDLTRRREVGSDVEMMKDGFGGGHN